jgi:rhodanese-related sulfurtransferase
MRLFSAGFFLLLLTAFACAPARPPVSTVPSPDMQLSTSPEAPLDARFAALRAGDVDAIVALFAEDATVRSSGGRISTSPEEIRAFALDQVSRNQAEELVRPRQVEGDVVRWTVRVSRDDWRALGIEWLEVKQEAVVRNGKIRSFTNTLTPESAARLRQTRETAAPPSIRQAITGEPDAKTAEVSTAELQQILAMGSAVVLDNRPFMEFALGHIPGAFNVAPKPNMPLSEYTSDVAEVDRLLGGDKARPVVLYCNGPFCGKSKRVADDLLAAGYTNVRRYQLGAPVWRALGEVMVIEPEGVRYVFENDRTAWFVDARSPEEFATGSNSSAKNVWAGQVNHAKNDGRVPMEDHNTRIIVVGENAVQARAVAEELTRNAFHNVSYFAGTYAQIQHVLNR